MLKRFWNWLYRSSQNPQAVSLTIKGFFTAIIPTIIAIMPLIGVQLDGSSIGDFAAAFVDFVEKVLYVVAGGMALWGFGRKVANTVIKK